MRRTDICNIVNNLSADFSEKCRAYNADFNTVLSFDLKECYDIILNHCKKTGEKPQHFNFTQVNGCLFVDGQIMERIALRYDKPNYQNFNNSPDYESKILARQEMYY